MIISFRKKFLFLHTPKTGGTAIMDRLLPYARWQDRLAYQRNNSFFAKAVVSRFYPGLDGIERLTGLKMHASLADGETVFGRERLAPLFKFGVIRNPYTRTYSLYRFIARNPNHPIHALVKEQSFEWFVNYICKFQWARQRDRFCWRENSQIATDYIASYERFEMECVYFAKILKIDALTLPQALNAGDKEPIDYQHEFKNVRDIFLKWYRPDFEIFQYSDDINHALQPPQGSKLPVPAKGL